MLENIIKNYLLFIDSEIPFLSCQKITPLHCFLTVKQLSEFIGISKFVFFVINPVGVLV